jgi:hypothetical protein
MKELERALPPGYVPSPVRVIIDIPKYNEKQLKKNPTLQQYVSVVRSFIEKQGVKALNSLPNGYAPKTLKAHKTTHGEHVQSIRLNQKDRLFFVKDLHYTGGWRCR